MKNTKIIKKQYLCRAKQGKYNMDKFNRAQIGLNYGALKPGVKGEARRDAVFTGVSHSVHNQPYGHSVTAHHPCYGAFDTHPT